MTNNPTFTASFITRASRTKPEMSSVYVRIAVNTKRTEFCIIKNVPADAWFLFF